MYYFLLALIGGAAATTQVGVNGRLLSHLGSPILTSFISFSVGTLGLALVYALAVWGGVQQVPSLSGIPQTSAWMWVGGLLGAFYVFTTIICAPKIGFANLYSLAIAGQLFLAITFDHFGLLGSPLHFITPLRAAGVLFLITGVYLIQTH